MLACWSKVIAPDCFSAATIASMARVSPLMLLYFDGCLFHCMFSMFSQVTPNACTMLPLTCLSWNSHQSGISWVLNAPVFFGGGGSRV